MTSKSVYSQRNTSLANPQDSAFILLAEAYVKKLNETVRNAPGHILVSALQTDKKHFTPLIDSISDSACTCISLISAYRYEFSCNAHDTRFGDIASSWMKKCKPSLFIDTVMEALPNDNLGKFEITIHNSQPS